MGYDDFYNRARHNSQARKESLRRSLGAIAPRLEEIADTIEKNAEA